MGYLICTYFSHINRLLFLSSFAGEELLVWSGSTYLILLFLPLLLKSDPQIQSQNQCQRCYSLCSILRTSLKSGLMFKYLIHFDIYLFIHSFSLWVTFCVWWYTRQGQVSFFPCGCLVSTPLIEDILLSLLGILAPFLNINWLYTCRFICGCSILFHSFVYFYANNILFWLL